MKLKASEIAFVAICIVCIVVGISVSAKVRNAEPSGVIDVSTPESADTNYPVEVLNNATAEDFMEISGIGQVKASDIIAFRDAIGGFKRAEQLNEVSGISDATFSKIIEHFYSEPTAEPVETSADETVTEPVTIPSEPETAAESITASQTADSPKKTDAPQPTTASEAEKAIREVDINAASAEEIADALLIDVELAENLVSLREQIHYFSSVEEIYLVDGMSGETYRRVKDYIIIGG